MSDSNRIRVAYRADGTTAGWQILRRTSGGPTLTTNTEISNEVLGDRQVTDLILQSIESGGTIDFEFSASTFDDWMSSAFCDTWTADDPVIGTDSLVIGSSDILYEVLLSYQDIGKHIQFSGVRAGQMTFNFEAAATVTGSLDLAGTSYDDTYDPTLDTFLDANDKRVLRGADVGTVEIDDVAQTGTCIPGFSLTLNNNYTAGFCLGSTTPGKQSKGRAEATGTMTISNTASTFNQWSGLIAQDSIKVEFPFTDGTDSYKITIWRAKASGDPPAPGANEIVNWEWNYTATRDAVTGESLRIERTIA